jgi:hypothetical protein
MGDAVICPCASDGFECDACLIQRLTRERDEARAQTEIVRELRQMDQRERDEARAECRSRLEVLARERGEYAELLNSARELERERDEARAVARQLLGTDNWREQQAIAAYHSWLQEVGR